MSRSRSNPICQRIRQLRIELHGIRGKAAFARQLSLAPSTYDYYEADRVPPADVLLRIADAADVDLRWLISGQTSPDRPLPVDHPVLQRAAALLADHPQAEAPLSAFLEILIGTLAFPDPKLGPASADESPEAPEPPPSSAQGWIPVLGRSAAGVPALWDDPSQADGLTTLADRIDANVPTDRCQPATLGRAAELEDRSVQIFTLRTPPEGFDVEEFLVSPDLRGRHPRAFAVRIDGDSMLPEIRHGDLVVLSPDEPARPGDVAVVQVDGAIGVTCKLYHPQGSDVHLVPINEQVAPTTVPAGRIDWAFRVLARIRP